jgi:thioredoxin reductase (NADPH)
MMSMRIKKSALIGALLLMAAVGIWWSKYWSRPESSVFKDIPSIFQTKGDPIVPVAILGSGPAGLSAAVYAGRARLHTVVFQGPHVGGQLMETTYVENWPGMGKQLGSAMIKSVEQQALQFGARFVADTVTAVDWSEWPYRMTLASGATVLALSVVVATGSTPKKLNIPGEQAYWGKGVTTCAICDAAFYKDKKVVVIGGGDSAAEQVGQLAAYAREIIVLVRGAHMRASKAMQERIMRIPHVKILYNSSPVEVLGDQEHVTGIKIKTDAGVEDLPIDGVFLAIGHVPVVDLVQGAVELNDLGYIALACRSQQTSKAGVFAAGDVSDHQYRQAGVASGDGIKAALDAERFLLGHGYTDALAHQYESRLYDPVHPNELTSLPEIDSRDEFNRQVLQNKGLVIVDFYTQHCPSCTMIKPYVQSFAARYKNRVTVYLCDLDKIPELRQQYNIMSVPSLLIMHDGLVVGHTKAPLKKQELFDVLAAYIPEAQ